MEISNRNKKDDPLKNCILTFPGLEDEERNDGLLWKGGNVTLEMIDRHRQAVPLHPDEENAAQPNDIKKDKASFGMKGVLLAVFAAAVCICLVLWR